jgi:SAM-dependent methyltransferase
MFGYVMLTLAILFFLVINAGVLLWAASILGSWKAPYVPLPHESLPGIVKALRITPTSVVYDIGCGDGRILRAAHAKHPEATYKGIERAWYPYLLAKLCGKKQGVVYTRGDAFKEIYTDADRVVLYLLPHFVDEVAKKIAEDCKRGTRIVAVDFPITLWKSQEIIEQHDLPAHVRGRMLYIYELEKP